MDIDDYINQLIKENERLQKLVLSLEEKIKNLTQNMTDILELDKSL